MYCSTREFPPPFFFNSDFLGKCSFLLWTLWFSPHLEEVI